MQKLKRLPSLVVIIGILFVTGLTFADAFRSGSGKFGVSTVFGDEGDGASVNGEKDSESTGGDSVKSSDNGDENNQGDNQDEQRVETAGNKTLRTRSAERTQQNLQGEKQQEGDNQQGDNTDEQNGDNNDLQGEIADINKEVLKIEAKIAPLATADPKSFEAFNASLSEIKSLIAQLNATKDPAQLKTLIDTVDHKMERLDKMMEVAFENDNEQAQANENDNEDVAKQYKNTVAQFVHTLKTVDETGNEADKGIGEKVRVVAQAQNDSQVKVEDAISKVENRSGFVKFLVGPGYGNITEIKTAIAENQTRIKVLTDLMNQLTDPAVKLVLQNQIASLQEQNTKLQTFVTNSENGVSLFGWLAKMFS